MILEHLEDLDDIWVVEAFENLNLRLNLFHGHLTSIFVDRLYDPFQTTTANPGETRG